MQMSREALVEAVFYLKVHRVKKGFKFNSAYMEELEFSEHRKINAYTRIVEC